MKKLLKYSIFLVYILLIGTNVFVFINGMDISHKIVFYEKATEKLKKENTDLEMHLYKINSLQYTSSKAAELEFSKKADPYFLENLRFALKK